MPRPSRAHLGRTLASRQESTSFGRHERDGDPARGRARRADAIRGAVTARRSTTTTSRRCGVKRTWNAWDYARAVGLDGPLHPDVHARGGMIAAGMAWWQALAHDPRRQPDRARADPAQLASRHEVRHPVPGVRARRVRHDRRELSGADARDRRVRLVRHQRVDRRPGAADFFVALWPGWATLLGSASFRGAHAGTSGSRSCCSGASTS